MVNIYSKSEDVVWLAHELKNSLGEHISFNSFGITNPILTGVYTKEGHRGPYYRDGDIRFYIKFCKDCFLRIQIPEECNKAEDVINAMDALVNAISTINVNNSAIGFPLAIYETDKCDKSLTCEYAFKRVEKTIKALQDGTIFDDDDVLNLKFINKTKIVGEILSEDICNDKEISDKNIPNIKILCNNFDINKKSRV